MNVYQQRLKKLSQTLDARPARKVSVVFEELGQVVVERVWTGTEQREPVAWVWDVRDAVRFCSAAPTIERRDENGNVLLSRYTFEKRAA